MRTTPWKLLTAGYELTLQCNMQCIHCGSSAGDTRKKELTLEQWNKVTKQLTEMNCKDIALIGGEPFLNRDWFEIANNIKNYTMNVSIVTNGWCVTDDVLSQIRSLDPYAVALSIDGGSPLIHDAIRRQPGSFERCLTALERLRKENVPTTVITTVHKKNLHDLPLLRNLLVKKGIAWQLQLAAPMGRFPRELALSKDEFYAAALFIASTRKHYSVQELPIIGAHCFGYNSRVLPNINLIPIWKGCQAGISLIGIQSDGGVKGCLSLPDEFVEGNVATSNLTDIWDNAKPFSYNRHFSLQDLTNDCIDCKYGKTCKGGCLSLSTAMTGKKHGDPYCLSAIEKHFA
jgi:radical SAM protein with 4Fe4S-binding SPASM domain